MQEKGHNYGYEQVYFHVSFVSFVSLLGFLSGYKACQGKITFYKTLKTSIILQSTTYWNWINHKLLTGKVLLVKKVPLSYNTLYFSEQASMSPLKSTVRFLLEVSYEVPIVVLLPWNTHTDGDHKIVTPCAFIGSKDPTINKIEEITPFI